MTSYTNRLFSPLFAHQSSSIAGKWCDGSAAEDWTIKMSVSLAYVLTLTGGYGLTMTVI